MAAKWQRWMPMEVDALKASPAVQAMHPCARAGYVWLLLSAWQTDDCTIPSDPMDLADESGLGDELWATHGLRILRKFDPVEGTNRLRNLPQYERWKAAKAVYDARKGAAEKTNDLRSPIQKSTVTDTESSRSSNDDRTPPSSFPPHPLSNSLPFTGTETVTEKQIQKQILSAKVKPSAEKDERFSIFRKDYETAFKFCNNVPAPWDAKEASQLSRWLKKNPTITQEQWQTILRNRKLSPGINLKLELSAWIKYSLSWLDGLADGLGRPIKINGGNHATVSNGKGGGAVGVLEEFINDTERSRTANENGNLSPSQYRQDNTKTIHGISGTTRLEGISGSNAKYSLF